MSKNYCREHEVKRNKTQQTKLSEKIQAFLNYLRRPKTMFDLQDRIKALVILAVVVIIVQYLLKKLIL